MSADENRAPGRPDLPATPSGLELLRNLQQEDAVGSSDPSVRQLLGMRFDLLEHGRVEMSFPTAQVFANPFGTVHGGVLTTLLDSVMGCAVHSTLPAGVTYSTLELKVNFIRPGRIDGSRLRGVGTIIHGGRRTAVAEGQVFDVAGKLVAHATTTCLIAV